MNPAELFSKDPDTLSLNAGDVLFREGEAGDRMYVLLEGAAEITVGGKCVESAGPGALLGEVALIDRSPRSATVTATAPSRFAQVDQRRFHFLVQQTPFFATHVLQVLSERLRSMNKRVAEAGN